MLGPSIPDNEEGYLVLLGTCIKTVILKKTTKESTS